MSDGDEAERLRGEVARLGAEVARLRRHRETATRAYHGLARKTRGQWRGFPWDHEVFTEWGEAERATHAAVWAALRAVPGGDQ